MMDGGSYLVHLELRKCILFKSIGLSKSFLSPLPKNCSDDKSAGRDSLAQTEHEHVTENESIAEDFVKKACKRHL